MQQGFGSFRVLPTVVKNLLIINGLFFLASWVSDDTFGFDLIKNLGLYYVGSDYFKPFQFISHLFMHGSFWHLFSNMFALWMFGSALENVWGPKRFLIFYLVTGLGAAVLHSVTTAYEVLDFQAAVQLYTSSPSADSFMMFIKEYGPSFRKPVYIDFINKWMAAPTGSGFVSESIREAENLLEMSKNIPTVGASGAVFGVLLGFGMLFPNQVIYLNFLFPVKAKYFVMFYGLFELYSGIQSSEGDNIAHFAHLGGMIFGYFLIKYWRNQRNTFY